MPLPAAVRQQGERAEQLLKAAGQPEPAPQPQPGVTVHNPDLRPAAEPGQAPAQGAQPPAQAPDNQPARQPDAPPQGQDTENLNPDQLRHRLKTVEGLLRTEADKAKRLETEKGQQGQIIQNLSSLVSSLQNQVGDLSKRVDAGAAGQPPQADGQGAPGGQPQQDPLTRKLDPDAFEGYGDEMKDAIALLNQQAEEISRLRGEMGNVGQQVEQRFEQMGQGVAEQNFYRDLNAGAPDWQAINPREDWRAWLTQPHDAHRLAAGEVYGWSRDQVLQQAYQRGDGQRVVQLIRDFKEDMGFAGNVPQQQPGGGNGGRPSLEDQAMPGPGAGGSPSPAGPGGQQPAVTKDQFEQASRDAAQGKITAEEYQKVLGQYTQQFGGAGGAP